MHMQKVGRIARRRFADSEDAVLEVLRRRLKGEKNVSVRRALKEKIGLFCQPGKAVPATA